MATSDTDLARELRLAVAQFKDSPLSLSAVERLLGHVEDIATHLEHRSAPTPEPQSIRADATPMVYEWPWKERRERGA